jgi:hypothetical protein
MAIVQNIREKVHLPIYDSIAIKPGEQMRPLLSSGTLKFFVDVQGKTKLETNLQAASLLPHYNTFEARAMRVVISDLPPRFNDEEEVELTGADSAGTDVDFTVPFDRAIELLDEARRSDEGEAELTVDTGRGDEADDDSTNTSDVTIEAADIEAGIADSRVAPSDAQLAAIGNGGSAAAFIDSFVYNTVTALYVGEKLMMEMPTWFFPGGAGTYSQSSSVATHGEPSPTATFRFAEPIYIDKQQNFRVEIDVPDSEFLKDLQKTYGPLFIWVVLDGYMTRGVQ